MKYNPTEIGARIKSLRLNLGHSQESFSECLHISREHLARIESGSRNPSIDLIIEIADTADVTLDYLILGKTADTGLKQELHSIINALNNLEKRL